ncbi:MAG TPA: cupredoxin domain-containing protein [Xanthomonadaceae bacterium]|jgi:plastocyanin
MQRLVAFFLLALVPLIAVAADAPGVPEFTLTIQDHRFTPTETTIPADTKVKLIVVNKDVTAEEFESHDMQREKIVAGLGTINVFVGPLKAGKYVYFGDFHRATAQGTIVAK